MSSAPRAALFELHKSRRPGERLDDPPLHPSEFDLIKSARSARIKRALLALARFLVVSCIGVAATLVWQSHGDAARRMIAGLAPQLEWLAPQATPVAQVASAPSGGASPDQLAAIARGLAAVRQSVDRLAADFARLQAPKQDASGPDVRVGRTPTSAPPPQAAVGAPARKPVPPQAQPLR